MVSQFALCHVGSHLVLFISARIWRAQVCAPRCRSLLRKQQQSCPWTPSSASSTQVPPISQTRTYVQSILTVCPSSLHFFLLSQPSKCPMSHTTIANNIYPTKFHFHNSKPNLTSDITTAGDTLRFHQQIACRSRNQLRWGPGRRRNGKWRFQFRHGRCRSESSWLMPYRHSEEFQQTEMATKWSVGDPQSSSEAVRHKSRKCSPCK